MVVERDTKAVQVFAFSDGNFVLMPPSADGWTLLRPIDVELRTELIDAGSVLHLRLRGEPETDRAV